jgi:hypothetical protein
MADPTIDPTADATTVPLSAAPIIPNQYTPPPPTATPDMGGGGVPQTPAPTSPQVTPTAAATVLGGDPGAMMNQAAAVHHSRIASTLNAVGTLLGGDTAYHVVTNRDGSVDAIPMPMTPGEKWGRIAKAALMGAAKGFEVGQGPGGAQRAAAAGIETGMAMPQAQQDQTMAQAQKANDQNQQKLLFNANMAYLNTRNLEASWALGNNKQLASDHEEDRDLQFNQAKNALHMIDVGPADDVEQAATLYNGNQQVQQALVGNGGQLIIHHPASGPPHAYIIPEDRLAQLNPKEQTAYQYSVDPKSGDLIKTPSTVAANTETGANTASRLSLENAAMLNAVKIGSDVKLKNAQAEEARAKANAPPKEQGTWQPFEDPNTGAPLERNSVSGAVRTPQQGVARLGTFDKRMAAHQKEFGSAVDSLNFANDYVTAGTPSGTSDEALMDKYFDLTKPSTGFRMTKPQQDMLKQAQDAKDSIVSSAKHYLAPNAPYFSPTLRNNIVQTMNEIGKARGIPIVNGRATLPPLPGSQAAGGGGAIDIPAPIAPARPGGNINTTLNGKTGTLSATGLFTPDDGSAPTQVPGRGGATGAPVVVTAPDGSKFQFPTQAAADAFKKTAGMQ